MAKIGQILGLGVARLIMYSDIELLSECLPTQNAAIECGYIQFGELDTLSVRDQRVG